jgi:alkylated DNA repair dioxygenase AlkB
MSNLFTLKVIMMTPIYIPNFLYGMSTQEVFNNLNKLPWVQEVYARQECFMAETPTSYQYLNNGPIYNSIQFNTWVKLIMDFINIKFKYSLNVCFLNKYIDQTKGLNWHSDDHVSIDHTQPICVVSLGQPREIWFREIGKTGVVEDNEKQLLEDGSLFIMPPGFQQTHFHRIPKGNKEMKVRISLTFRSWK